MTERWVAKVMGERQRLGEVLVQPERARQRPGDLGHFQGVAEARAVVVALMEHENLGLVLETAKGGRVDDPVGIPPEWATARARRLWEQPPAAPPGILRI